MAQPVVDATAGPHRLVEALAMALQVVTVAIVLTLVVVTVTVAVTAAVAGTRSWSLTLDKAVIEATAMGDTHAANIGSIISGSGSAEVIYQAGTGETNNFVEQVNSGNDNGFVAFELFLDASSKKILFAGVTTSAEVTSTVGELSIVTVNFVTTGPITLTL